MNVGVRDLRDNLSRHLTAVKGGEEVVVTDHGRPVAKLVPYGELTKFDQMVAEGRITPARRPKGQLPEPLPAEGTVSDLVSEQRG
ncbi:MAG: type II toxin-antitoxin system prevent-host-death family antitoxin [Solirubrobacterales bacterium]|nr:type II toxin-antitoxin system prevent-host-death family antitoxin [Solirubrobacterales bacterium]